MGKAIIKVKPIGESMGGYRAIKDSHGNTYQLPNNGSVTVDDSIAKDFAYDEELIVTLSDGTVLSGDVKQPVNQPVKQKAKKVYTANELGKLGRDWQEDYIKSLGLKPAKLEKDRIVQILKYQEGK